MRNPFSQGLVVGFITIIIGLGSLNLAHGREMSDTSGTAGLQSIGQPGGDAVPLKIWTDKEPGQVFKQGDRAVVSFQAERTAYLTALAVSSDGDVHIIFPNKELPNNMIQQGKVYTLFGDDSSLRLETGKNFRNAGIIFFLSSKPFSLDLLKTTGDQPYLFIPASSTDKINELKDKLKDISRKPGFNRVVLPLIGGYGRNLEPKFSVLSAQPTDLLRKDLSGGVESSTPEALTGSAGLKPKPLREQGHQR
ncbi:MAG: DUF4384 domain-containing protein [Desulfomonilaceae bacterium]